MIRSKSLFHEFRQQPKRDAHLRNHNSMLRSGGCKLTDVLINSIWIAHIFNAEHIEAPRGERVTLHAVMKCSYNDLNTRFDTDYNKVELMFLGKQSR